MYTIDMLEAVQALLQRPNITHSVLKIELGVIIHVYVVAKLWGTACLGIICC